MTYVFYFLASILMLLSIRSLFSGIDYLRYFKEQLAMPRKPVNARISIIAPCRGIEPGLRENLRALMEQDHPAFEVLFVTDSETDEAVPVIDEILSAYQNGRRVVAPKAVNSGQKVENIREAVRHISAATDTIAFVDSDARPAPEWLSNLTAPLCDVSVGITTGYRWFLPQHSSFAGELLSAWNASIASALGRRQKANFCWGGSMAIRRRNFELLDIRQRLAGTVSDDFTMAAIVKEAGLGIYFVPQALSASFVDLTLAGVFEFTTRQMKITRVYSPGHWLISLIGSLIFLAAMAWSIYLTATGEGFPRVAAIFTLTVVIVLSTAKAWLRMRAVRSAMPRYAGPLRRQMLPQLTLWLAAPILFAVNCIAGIFSRTIRWRGITYEMISAKDTRTDEK